MSREFQIKPCPFCGETKDFGVMNKCRGTEDPENYPTYLYCGNCGAQGPWFWTRNKEDYKTKEGCAELSGWNNRVEK